jgi:hypothetical protein
MVLDPRSEQPGLAAVWTEVHRWRSIVDLDVSGVLHRVEEGPAVSHDFSGWLGSAAASVARRLAVVNDVLS